MKGVWLEDLTWVEAGEKFKAGWPVIIPIGARAKEHGHHLPLKTDYLLARELGQQVANALPVVVAPVVDFGYYPAFVNYPGSQNLQADTFINVLCDLIGNFIDHGVTNIAVVNTGVSTEAPLRIAVRNIYEDRKVRVITTDIRMLGGATRPLMKQKMGGHGDEHETSMILAIEPKSVKMHLARTDYGNALSEPKTVFYVPTVFDGRKDSGPDYSITGVRGDPSLATAEKGRKIIQAMAKEIVEGLQAHYPDAFKPKPKRPKAAPRRQRGAGAKRRR